VPPLRRTRMGRYVPLLAASFVVGGAVAPSALGLTLVYDTSNIVRDLVSPGGQRGLSPERGALRQDPGGGGMFAPGDNSRYRVAKVSDEDIVSRSAGDIASLLKSQIRRGRVGATSHLVSIDEIGRPFGEAPPSSPRRGGAPSPVDANSPGARFTAAMRILASEESPYGGTWASRVHVYVAPGMSTAIGAGRGPDRNRGRDGKPHRPSWQGVMPGLALTGGVHLQMYNGKGGSPSPFSAANWRRVPSGFLTLFGRYGGDGSRLHFIFTGGGVPAGASGCSGSQNCAWKLAESTPAGRGILANRPGVYRIGGDARAWLREFNARFP
jgi:hypothetical protein